MRVPSNPRKNVIKLVAEKVMTRNHNIIKQRAEKLRVFVLLAFWRWPALASKETGASHSAKKISGVFILSLVRLHPIFSCWRLVGTRSRAPMTRSAEVWVTDTLHVFFLGAVNMVRQIPVMNKRRVNIFSLLPTLVLL